MDFDMKQRLSKNTLVYQKALERIIDKYSKLPQTDDSLVLDLGSEEEPRILSCMKASRLELNKLKSQNVSDVSQDSSLAPDISRNSQQLDLTYQDAETNESRVSDKQFCEEDNETTRNASSVLMLSSLDESQRNLSEIDFQPEDQDEELEMTLRSNGSSFVDLYPTMISRIERAWHRQNVSEAAHSVQRRYRRWRQRPHNLNNTFNITRSRTNNNPRKMAGETLGREKPNCSKKGQFMRSEAAPRPPLQMSPERVRVTHKSGQHKPVTVIDFSEQTVTYKPKGMKLIQLDEHPCTSAASPSQTLYSRKMSLSAQSEQVAGWSTYAPAVTAVKESPDIYSSPVKQSPLKTRLVYSPRKSPSRALKESYGENISREPMRRRLLSTSLSSPQRAVLPQRMCSASDYHPYLKPQMHSPRSATAERRHRLRRHLSLDSSLSLPRVSPKKVDEDFIKLYHKYVCQNKSSFFNRLPCRFCDRNTETRRTGHFSSSLAALALSPHRSALNKRHREVDWDSDRQSKRYRDEYCTSSPGSKRHLNEKLRRRLCQSDLPYSRSIQHRSAEPQPEAWRWEQSGSAAEFSGLGQSFESFRANGCSPRKW